MDMRFGTWNIRSLYKSGLLKTIPREIAKYKLGLVGVQEVRWDKGATEPGNDYTFFCGSGNADDHLGIGFVVHKGIISLVNRPELVSDRMSY
jgi:hypothetical protein